jgi:uncharacterized protein YbdZ (MbtH family)
MIPPQETPAEQHRVVVNGEEQYSIWPVTREIPSGWVDSGVIGDKAHCLRYIDETWTDMRPLSLRQWMAESAEQPIEIPAESQPPYKSLAERLSGSGHPVAVAGASAHDPSRLNEEISRGHIRVCFTETAGGTELALRFNPSAVDWSGEESGPAKRRAMLSSELTLDGVRVRCAVDINLADGKGKGSLTILGEG